MIDYGGVVHTLGIHSKHKGGRRYALKHKGGYIATTEG